MIEPSPQRRQHDRITRDAAQLADSAGLIGVPWRAEGLLARLERHGDIGRRERSGGELFAELFARAGMDALRAADMNQRSRSPTVPHGAERARRQIHAALDALGGLGSPCGSCAWFICGLDLSLRQFALRESWAGKPIRPEVAKGTLIATLSLLARHFNA